MLYYIHLKNFSAFLLSTALYLVYLCRVDCLFLFPLIGAAKVQIVFLICKKFFLFFFMLDDSLSSSVSLSSSSSSLASFIYDQLSLSFFLSFQCSAFLAFAECKGSILFLPSKIIL